MKPKFDNRICEECALFWGLTVPKCHYKGKHIYEGECIAFVEKEKPPSETEQIFREWEAQQRQWN